MQPAMSNFDQAAQSWRARTAVLMAAAVLAAAILAACASLVPKPLPPQVALQGIRVTRLTPLDARLAITLIVRNPNTYDLFVKDFGATVSVDDKPLFTGTLTAPVTLVASGETRVEIEASTDFRAIASALELLTRLGNVPYEIAGSAVVQNGLRLPFSRRGELPAGEFLGQPR